MEKLEIGRLLRKAQVLTDDIREMESVDVEKAFERMRKKAKAGQRKRQMEQLMRYAAM